MNGALVDVDVIVNGVGRQSTVEARTLLSDFLRHDLGLTGTHVGCEHGVCGACTVLVDGVAVRSCLMFAPQVSGAQVTTVEGLAPQGQLSELQEAFREHHGLQCGFCTPGMLCAIEAALAEDSPLEEIQDEVLSGHVCRCTGYSGIRAAIRSVYEARAALR